MHLSFSARCKTTNWTADPLPALKICKFRHLDPYFTVETCFPWLSGAELAQWLDFRWQEVNDPTESARSLFLPQALFSWTIHYC